jgi:hypothetical protein
VYRLSSSNHDIPIYTDPKTAVVDIGSTLDVDDDEFVQHINKKQCDIANDVSIVHDSYNDPVDVTNCTPTADNDSASHAKMKASSNSRKWSFDPEEIIANYKKKKYSYSVNTTKPKINHYSKYQHGELSILSDDSTANVKSLTNDEIRNSNSDINNNNNNNMLESSYSKTRTLKKQVMQITLLHTSVLCMHQMRIC